MSERENLKKRMCRKGFTLIELLIVVAIIAILAAIAVPNFLEAQVRAKIARVKADQRTLAVGVETYMVDWNDILGGRDWGQALGIGGGTGRLYAYSRLTTPVAYLTSIPRDPFQIGNKDGPNGGRVNNEFNFQTSHSYSPANWDKPRLRGYIWVFHSDGPHLDRSGPAHRNILRGVNEAAKAYMYDATNGTNSDGPLLRTNKGIYAVDHADGV